MLAGYRDSISVASGESVGFFLHSEEEAQCDVALVRVLYGGTHPSSPGPILEDVTSDLPARYVVSPQTLCAGSYARLVESLPKPLELSACSFACAVFPTAKADHPQTIVGGFGGGTRLVITADSRLALYTSAGLQLTLSQPLPSSRWTVVGFSYGAQDQRLRLFQRPIDPTRTDIVDWGEEVYRKGIELSLSVTSDFALATELWTDDYAKRRPRESFNGRMEAPRLVAGTRTVEELVSLVMQATPSSDDIDLIGFWDFGASIPIRRIDDLSPAKRHLETVNLPNRGVRGYRWDGSVWEWTQAPHQYAAIHFHDSDVYDADWEKAFDWQVPMDTPSGLYALKVSNGEETHYISFFVTARGTEAKSQLVFVASTATYLAYANEQARALMGSLSDPGQYRISPEEQQLRDNPSFGRSQYELHTDYSGIHYSSFLRPTPTWQPGTQMWSLNADTAILHFLVESGIEFDLVTDHDLHEAPELLSRYTCAMTGSHPEYLSPSMLESFESFLDGGGRLVYMGGNGFYWRIALSESWPAAIEVRRCEASTRAWVAEPGEYFHAFDGAYGGLWRNQGRAPNRLVGIGFAAQGFGESMPYHKTEAASDPRAAFIFEDVDEAIIGDFGTLGGGAAGEEIDRFDRSLGSPPHALVVAKTEKPPQDMLRVIEEFASSLPPGPDRRIRADMTFFETRSGGAVFSTGSIAWSGALCHNQYDNSVAQITKNVVQRFLDPKAFEVATAGA